MAKIPFSKGVLEALNKHTGMLKPEHYLNSDSIRQGDDAWTFIDRCQKAIAGKEAEGETPLFLVVAHRGRKRYKVEFPQVLMPQDPNVSRRASTDPTKEAPTNYWPAIVAMTPEIELIWRSSGEVKELNQGATVAVKEWLGNTTLGKYLTNITASVVLDEKKNLRDDCYQVTLTLYPNGVPAPKVEPAVTIEVPVAS